MQAVGGDGQPVTDVLTDRARRPNQRRTPPTQHIRTTTGSPAARRHPSRGHSGRSLQPIWEAIRSTSSGYNDFKGFLFTCYCKEYKKFEPLFMRRATASVEVAPPRESVYNVQ